MLLEHIQNAETRKGLQVKRDNKHNVPWELVGIFVQISNHKISVIQFRSLAYRCLYVMSATKAVVQITTVW